MQTPDGSLVDLTQVAADTPRTPAKGRCLKCLRVVEVNSAMCCERCSRRAMKEHREKQKSIADRLGEARVYELEQQRLTDEAIRSSRRSGGDDA